jgi:hypothetical protein
MMVRHLPDAEFATTVLTALRNRSIGRSCRSNTSLPLLQMLPSGNTGAT